jgi:predicted benzoate:H+ symporter BenE
MAGKRSTTDLLLLMIAGTVCLILMGATAGLVVEKLLHPDSNAAAAAQVLSGALNILIGLLAGFLTGRTERTARKKDDDEQ